MTKKLTSIATVQSTETQTSASALTQQLEANLRHPATSPDFDLFNAVNQVLSDVGMTIDDCGGKLGFHGRDPIVPSPLRYGTMAGVGLAARSVALAALCKQATGDGQDISIDIRKALRRFCGFAERRWETINGRPPTLGSFAASPFLNPPWFNETRDGRYAVAIDFYPGIRARTLNRFSAAKAVNRSPTPFVNDEAQIWRRLQLKLGCQWRLCVPTRNFAERFNTPKCSQKYLSSRLRRSVRATQSRFEDAGISRSAESGRWAWATLSPALQWADASLSTARTY